MTTATGARPSTASGYLPPWLARIPPHLRTLIVILIAALLLRLWPISGVASDYDEGVYWQSLRAMASGQPLFTSIFSSQPPFFLLCIYPFYMFLGQTLLAARLGIVFYSLIGILGLYIIGREIGGRWAGIAAAAFLAFEPIYLTESHTLQAEAPSIAFEIVCIALAVSAFKSTGRLRLALAAGSGVFFGLGVLTKLSDVVAIIPALLYLIPWGETSPSRLRSVFRAITGALPAWGSFLLGAIVSIVVVLAPFAAHLDLVYDQVVRFHTTAARVVDKGLGYNILQIVQAGQLYPLLLIALIAFALALIRRSWVIFPPLAWLLATLILLLDQQPLMTHHRALLSAPLALVAALLLPLMSQTFAGGPVHFARVTPPVVPRIVPFALATLVIFISLTLSVTSARSDARGPSALQTQIYSALERFSLPDELVATDDQYIAGLADRSVLPQLVDTSGVRIFTHYLTAPQIEGLLTQADTRVILFSSGRFDGIPGFRAWVQDHYTLVTTFPDNGALYIKGNQGPPIT